MTFLKNSLENLEKQYGAFSSWALWNTSNKYDVKIITENVDSLRTTVVMVGLNISAPLLESWSNFHFGPNDRKLIYAFNDSPYRGAYLTDIIKNEVQAKSHIILRRIRKGEIDINQHIAFFRKELADIGANERSLFVLFGGAVSQLFTKYLALSYPNYVACPHYSCHGTDAAWVDETWNILERHSRETNTKFNTEAFERNGSMNQLLQRLLNR